MFVVETMMWGACAKRASRKHFTRSRCSHRRVAPPNRNHHLLQWLQIKDFAHDRPVGIPTYSAKLLSNWTPDAPGATYLAYTLNGKKLVTAGVDNYCRVFSTGSDDEPVTVDDCQENNTTVVAGVRTMCMSNLV
jgi:hypothetical protein